MYVKFEDLEPIDQEHINTTIINKQVSTSKKRKVSALIGISNRNNTSGIVLTSGINYMFPQAYSGKCEDENGETIPYVIHAEEAAIWEFQRNDLMYKNIIYSEDKEMSDVTIYVTYSPCQNCCKMIALAGIRRIVFVEKHVTNFHDIPFPPQEFLEQLNIEVIQTSCPTKTN